MNEAEKVVDVLLEMEDGIDPKEYLDQNAEEMINKWEQIGGDFGDPWVHGGDWFNLFKREIIHIDGLEGEGINEIDEYDLETTVDDDAMLLREYPVKIDPEFPEDGDENERDRNLAKSTLLTDRAEKMNQKIAVTVYRFLDEDITDDDWPDQEAIKSSMDMDDDAWADMPTASKWIEIGRHHGFHELDHYPEKWTKEQLSKFLGIEL